VGFVLRRLVLFLFAAVLSTEARAGCIDHRVGSVAEQTPRVEICVEGGCQVGILTRTCGNIHYASGDFQTEADRWTFRIRFSPGDVVAHEAIQNGRTLGSESAVRISCLPADGQVGCGLPEDMLAHWEDN